MTARLEVDGMGLGSVDVCQLTPRNQELFLNAVENAYNTQKERGPVGWASPDTWPSWIERFYDLADDLCDTFQTLASLCGSLPLGPVSRCWWRLRLLLPP
jgi:hypothetical protein